MRTPVRHAAVAVALAAILGSCTSSSSTTPANTQTMTKVAGDNQSVTVSTTLTTKPSVKITDQNGAPVSGVVVTFTVTSGNGLIPVNLTMVSTTTVSTGSDGTATVPGWLIGSAIGTNTMTASASGVTGSPVTFTVTGTAVIPVPTIVGKVGGTDNQTYPAGAPASVPPGVIVRDQTNTPMSGVTVTFAVASGGGSIAGAVATTNSLGVATVGSWTLGSVAGTNTITATVSGYTGAAFTFTATGIASFSPTSNTTLSGTQLLGSVNIPAGVTVTMTADVTLNVIGNVAIAGTLTGDCKNLTISSGGVFTSTGNINNGCSTPTATPTGILIVATGGYHVTAGTFTLSGLLNLTNDATLTDGTFPAPPAGLKVAAPDAALRQAGVCGVAGTAFTASPATAQQGADGNPAGARGTDGATWVLQCTGELDINGGVNVTGQGGGAGGAGTNSSGTAANATGGPGGAGGTIKVRANNGSVIVSGSNTISSGSGGAGGAATATGTGAGNPGASATSLGGVGAAPGNIVMQAVNGGIDITGGTVNLVVGSSGNGGAATSVGGLGQTATPCNAGAGGFATATGGAGGSTPDKTLKATGTVGGVANVTVTGGNPGIGGKGTATGGNGGNGAQTCPTGGAGGATTATGGQGGNSLLKNAAGALFANGGQGGAMEDLVGKGGNGWSDCLATPGVPGGAGGAGGAAGGKNGAGGTGLQNGAPGAALFTVVANGGNGGDGSGPGAGGAAGASTATITVIANTTQPSFTPGIPGTACVPVGVKYTSMTNNSGTVAPGTQPVQTTDVNGVVNGTISITTVNTTFVAGSPQQRAGNSPGSSHSYNIGPTFMVNGLQYMAKSAEVCVLNSTGLNAQNPVMLTQLDINGIVLQTDLMVAEICQSFVIQQVARIFRLSSAATIDHYVIFNGHN